MREPLGSRWLVCVGTGMPLVVLAGCVLTIALYVAVVAILNRLGINI